MRLEIALTYGDDFRAKPNENVRYFIQEGSCHRRHPRKRWIIMPPPTLRQNDVASLRATFLRISTVVPIELECSDHRLFFEKVSSVMSDDTNDVDVRIEELERRIVDARKTDLIATSWRLSRELKRLAKQERRVIPYLTANFYLMNDAQSLFEPDEGKQVSLESIAMLESEELARQLQPDFPEAQYRHAVFWMSTCSYDNLATHVAEMEGYNSNGIHDCISDGLQICRRTGKLECTSCFREYAGDVYRASDDLDMAVHYARAGMGPQPRSERMDRRWVSAKDLSHLLALQGDLQAALDTILQAATLIEGYHAPHRARLYGALTAETLLWMMGRESEWHQIREVFIPKGTEVTSPPAGENPTYELESVLRDVIISVRRQDLPAAVEQLTRWDRYLTSRKCLAQWFEVRLRLIAVQLIGGNRPQAEALARQLESKATPARDWLTLRRLRRLMTGEVPPSPFVTVAPITIGPFATKSEALADRPPSPDERASVNASSEVTQSTGQVDVNENSPSASTPLEARILQLQLAAQSADQVEQANKIVDEILSISPSSVTAANDAARLSYLALPMAGPSERIREVWEWAKPFVVQFAQDATTVNVMATVAWSARNELPVEERDSIATADQIEKWFRASLDLDPENPRNHARAGQFHWSEGREGEAERCWSRSFRLNRSDSRVAQQLAFIYDSTDRRSDGLAILDMCIREGTDDADLFWSAAMSALALDRWELVVTYLDRFEQLSPNAPWTQYYRGLALIELDRAAEADDALAMQAERNPDQLFGVSVLRAAAAASQKRLEDAKTWVDAALNTKLTSVDYLSLNGFIRLFEKLYTATLCLPEGDVLRSRFESVAFQSGMMPDSYFDLRRKQEQVVEGLSFYVVEVNQPLDERWADHPGCLANQEDWKSYNAHWGVLATDIDVATQVVLGQQSRCFPLAPEIVEINLQGDGFKDSPGITWQGRRDEFVEEGDLDEESDEPEE